MSGKYTVKLANGTTLGTITTETEPLGTGGEGSVYSLTSITSDTLGTADSLVAKSTTPTNKNAPPAKQNAKQCSPASPKQTQSSGTSATYTPPTGNSQDTSCDDST